MFFSGCFLFFGGNLVKNWGNFITTIWQHWVSVSGAVHVVCCAPLISSRVIYKLDLQTRKIDEKSQTIFNQILLNFLILIDRFCLLKLISNCKRIRAWIVDVDLWVNGKSNWNMDLKVDCDDNNMTRETISSQDLSHQMDIQMTETESLEHTSGSGLCSGNFTF